MASGRGVRSAPGIHPAGLPEAAISHKLAEDFMRAGRPERPIQPAPNIVGGSSSGRTPDSGSGNLGSNPSPPTTQSLLTFSSATKHPNFPANWGYFPALLCSLERDSGAFSARNSPFSPGEFWRATLGVYQEDCFSYTPSFRGCSAQERGISERIRWANVRS